MAAASALTRIGRVFGAIWSYVIGTVRIFRDFIVRVPTDLDRHLVAAMIMVAISVFGAVAAYRVALAEQRSVALERRLALAQLQDISARQDFLAEVLVRIGLTNMETKLLAEAVELRKAYKAFADTDGGAAAWLEWHAAELVAYRNTVKRFIDRLRTLDRPNLNVEQELATRSAEQLREQGFLAVVSMEPAKDGVVEPILSFPLLEHAIEKSHKVGPALAFCVLLFVLGLVCLTIAELELAPASFWGWLVSAGTLIAISATFAMLVIDPSAWLAVLLLTVLVVVVAFLAIRSGVLLRSHHKGHTPHPEAPEAGKISFAHFAGHSAHDTWSKSIVLLITAAVFTSAVFGWLYSVSLKHAGEYGLHAQEMRAELVNQRARLGAATMGGTFDLSIRFIVARMRCGAATQLGMLAEDGQVRIDKAEVEKERKSRCDELARMSKANERLVDTLDRNDLADSTQIPERRLQNDVFDRKDGPNQIFALSDGFAEVSAGWFSRAALLLAVLTVLAITLYLFGQAYTMGDTTAGRWLIGSGIALLCVSIGVGIYAWAQPVIVPPESELPQACKEGGDEHHAFDGDAEHLIEYAALQYATGVARQNRADTSVTGSKEQADADDEAAAALSCAILVRPVFIPAFQKYQRSIAQKTSPQRDESYSSLSSKTKLGDVHELRLRELKAFVKAGMLRPLKQLGSLAFNATVLALVDKRSDALADAQTVLHTITGQTSWQERLYVEWMRPELWTDEPPSTDPIDWLNLALSQMASGDDDQIAAAEVTYGKALKQEKGWSPKLLASVLTDLEILRTYCSNLYGGGQTCLHIENAIERVRPRLASGAGVDDLPKDSKATVFGFSASATAYSVEWQARIDGFDPKVDRLTVAWFRDDRPVGGEPADASKWQLRRALSDIFEIYYPGGGKLPSPGESNVTKKTTMLPWKADWCLAPGRYVAELFLNGVHVASADAPVAPHNLEIYRSRELDITWCIPKTWQYWSGNKEMHPWFPDKPMRGFVDGEASTNPPFGGAIMTFYAPPSMTEAQRQDYFLHRAIQVLLRKGQRNDKGELVSSWSLDVENRLARNAIPIGAMTAADCRSDTGKGTPIYRITPNTTDKNIIHVAVVDGKQPGKVACTILKSLSTYF